MPLRANNIPPALMARLDEVALASSELQDEWWVIGSSAMLLIGLRSTFVEDVDVLTSHRDAMTLFRRWKGQRRPAHSTGSDLFRSTFGRFFDIPFPLEVMGDLQVRCETEWVKVRPESRIEIEIHSGVIFIPSLDDQIKIARQFGRPKDLLRAEGLEKLKPFST